MSNTATLVAQGTLRWLRGREGISSWQKESGFRTDFCATCGSPVPNPLRDQPYFWVPAGLLESEGDFEIVAHLCTASKPSWAPTPEHGVCYDGLPDLPGLIALLHPVSTSGS